MDIEHQNFLFEQFDFLRPKETDNTPLKERGIECGDGWLGIIMRLCKRLDSLKIKRFQVTQVKEKLGTLCFYFENAPKSKLQKVIELINEAELESSHTCEICGAPGRLKVIKWLRLVRCNSCTLT